MTVKTSVKLTASERAYLKLGLGQPGNKLPLFDNNGQRINVKTIESCIKKGVAERWFQNPIQPDWLVCKLTDQGIKSLKR